MGHKFLYTPATSLNKPINFIGNFVRDIPIILNLGHSMAIRDMKSQYRRSLLSFSWLIISPLLQASIWIGLVKFKAFTVSFNLEVPYTIYLFTGLLLYSIFSEGVTVTQRSIIDSKQIIGRVNFPRESLLYSAFIQSMIYSGLRILLIYILLVSVFFYHDIQLQIPLLVLSLIIINVLAVIIGAIFGGLSLLSDDVERVVNPLLTFIMFLSPVLFVASGDSTISQIIESNPLSPIIELLRSVILSEYRPTVLITPLWALSILIFILINLLCFRIVFPIAAERVST